jgi:putative toxin-antitoxin system antitoxin component (TIGR02293 family)
MAIMWLSMVAMRTGIIAKRYRMTVQQLVHSDSSQLITAVREGLPFESFTTLRQTLELSTDELAQLLSVPRRTLTKRQKEKAFTRSESNAISRVTRIYREAVSFFEDEERALRWLKTPLPALDNHTPLSLLDTDPGAEVVSILLRQLAWGIYP